MSTAAHREAPPRRHGTHRRDGALPRIGLGLLAVVIATSIDVRMRGVALEAAQAGRTGLKTQRSGRLFPPLDLGLLDAPDRDAWQKPDLIMDALGIADGATVADLGAGGGWFTIRLARRVGPNGLVIAQDIQQEMLDTIARRVQRENLQNVDTVLGSALDPNLREGLDAALIVDSYHEMNEPGRPEVIRTLLSNIARALKPQGRLGIVGFTPGDGGPGPAAEERVDPETVIASATSAGLRLVARERVPPFQYLLVFGRVPSKSSRP